MVKPHPLVNEWEGPGTGRPSVVAKDSHPEVSQMDRRSLNQEEIEPSNSSSDSRRRRGLEEERVADRRSLVEEERRPLVASTSTGGGGGTTEKRRKRRGSRSPSIDDNPTTPCGEDISEKRVRLAAPPTAPPTSSPRENFPPLYVPPPQVTPTPQVHAPQYPSTHIGQIPELSETRQVPEPFPGQTPNPPIRQSPIPQTERSFHLPSSENRTTVTTGPSEEESQENIHKGTLSLPSYSQSMTRHQQQQGSPHPPASNPPFSGPSHLEVCQQQHEAIMRQLEGLKQQQVHYHQFGATPQQWYQLQVQQQYLLQKQNVIDSQVQQLMMKERREEQLKLQQIEMEKREMERLKRLEMESEIRRQQQLEEEKQRQEKRLKEKERMDMQRLGAYHQHHLQGQQKETSSIVGQEQLLHHQPSLWKPISQTTPTSSTNYQSSKSFLTPPPSQSPSSDARTPPRHHSPAPGIQMQASPQKHQLQSPNLSSFVKGSPSALSHGSSPEIHSGFNTPISSDHTHGQRDTPPRHHLIGSTGDTSSQLPQHSIAAARQLIGEVPYQRPHPSQLMMSAPMYQTHNQQMGHRVEYINETEALLRRQEQQKMYHHQQLLQHQLRQQQEQLQHQQQQPATAGFLLQHGMFPLAGVRPQSDPSNIPHFGLPHGHSSGAAAQQGHTHSGYPHNLSFWKP